MQAVCKKRKTRFWNRVFLLSGCGLRKGKFTRVVSRGVGAAAVLIHQL